MNPIRIVARQLLPTLLCCAAFCSSLLAASSNASPNANKNKSSPPAATATTYSGRAVALDIEDVQVPVAGPIILADTGPLPTAGGSLEAGISDYTLLGTDGVTVALGVDFAHAATAGSGPETTSDSTLSGFQVRIDTPSGSRVTITADYIGASASAALAP